MIPIETISERFLLPEAPAGWHDYSYTALTDGSLALIRTQLDINAEHMRWEEAIDRGDQSQNRRDVWGADMRLSIFDGVSETNVAIMPSGKQPIVDRMADGRWLVAEGLARNNEKNGHIYSSAGLKEGEIVLGDGILHLLCSADGTIWAGYIDEVFGGTTTDGSLSGGIVQFSASGTPIWSFNEYARNNNFDLDAYVWEAYAMTLVGNDLWACCYMDFPITRISAGVPSFWSNSIAGAQAIAVAGDTVMLAGGYREDSDRIAVIKLEGTTSRKIGEMRYPHGAMTASGLVQGRGDILHIVSERVWLRTPVSRALEAIKEKRGT